MTKNRGGVVDRYAGVIAFLLVYSYGLSFIVDILFSTSSHIISYFTGVCGLLILGLFFWESVKTNLLYRYELICIIIFAIMLLLLWHTKDRFPNTKANITGVFNSFMARSIPSFFAGLLMAKRRCLQRLENWLIPLIITITAVMIVTVSKNTSRDITLFFSLGIDRQTLSYMASYMICWIMYLLSNFDHLDLLPIFRGGIWKVILIALFVANLIPLFAGGGRGAIVVVAAFVLFYLFYKLRPFHNIKNVSVILIVMVIFSFFWNYISNLPILSDGLDRITSLFSGTMDRSSLERLDIYNNSLQLFLQHPFIGDGPGSALCKLGIWSHNVWIDILADFGLLGIGMFLVLFINSLFVTFKNIRTDKNMEMAFILGMNSFIMLCFSGSYLSDGGLWFYISFCIAYRHLNPNNNRIEELYE